MVGTWKSTTSNGLKEKFLHFLLMAHWGGGRIWGRGFLLSTVGGDEAVTQRYVQYWGEQNTGHVQTEF